MIYFAGLFGEAIANIEIILNTGIYTFVNWMYQVFLYIASARLIQNDAVDAMKKRLMVLVGIVMLFIVAFSLLKAIIDPDKEIKNTSKIFTTVITSLIMLTLVNTAFNYLYEAQGIILKENLIGKIILGGIDTSDKDIDLSTAGINMAAHTLNAFFSDSRVDDDDEEDKTQEYTTETSIFGNEVKTRSEILDSAIENKSMAAFTQYAAAIDNGEIDFSWFLALICGGFMVYIFLSFCLDMAVRSIKLALLQIIAPIPIMARIIPGQESIFNNWIKKTLTAFMEVFIKLAIVFFGVYLIIILGNSIDGLHVNEDIIKDVGGSVKAAGYIAVVIGILLFIKQAPGYISEIFGVNSGDMKLGLKNKLSGMVGAGVIGGAVGSVAGAATGALGAGWSSKMNGGTFRSGMKYGAYSGWKGKGNQFNSQRQGMYNAMGFKGRAGWFGKQAHFDRKLDDVKNTYVDNYKDNVIPNLITEKEATPQFAKFRSNAEARWAAEQRQSSQTHTSNIANIESAREQARNEYYSPAQVANRENEYYNNINAQKSAMLAQRSAKVAEFNKYRREQMDALRSRVGIDPTATDEFKKFRDMKFEDSYIGKDYMNKLNKLENAKFEDTKFENSAKFKEFEAQIKKENDNFAAAMEKYNNEDIKNDTIHDWAQADMMDADETYKNYVKIDKARKNEKNLNKWANSMEGQQAIYASQQGYKNAQKNPADGQKPKGSG